MNNSKSKLVETTFAKPDIHQQWIEMHQNAENESFWNQAFNYIIKYLQAPGNSILLDAGCGNCAHSMRIANRGFFIQAIDFAEPVLEMARENVNVKGLEDKISIKQENISALTFHDETFNYILCWTVLMHIPHLEKAISELIRVLKPGGALVIYEDNMYSLQSIILRNLKRFLLKPFLGKAEAEAKKTPAGIEHWIISSAGTLLYREANTRWLIERFKSNGFTVKKHIPGQFTTAYTVVSFRLLRKLIHSFNKLWFRYIKIPHLALGNIIILQKEK